MSKHQTTTTLTAAAKALANEQNLLQRCERVVQSSENPQSPTATTTSSSSSSHSHTTQHRRHSSLSGRVCGKSSSLAKSASITDLANKLEEYENITLPDRISTERTARTAAATTTTSTTTISTATTAGTTCNRTTSATPKRDSSSIDEVDSDETRRRRLASSSAAAAATTKDCLESYDEPDHLQHRFSRTAGLFNARHNFSSVADNGFSDLGGGCTSGMSSVFSSPSASTVSSPLSTPTRLSPQHLPRHQQQQQQQSSCCQKSSSTPASLKNSCSSSISSNNKTLHLHDHHNPHHQQQQHQHHHHHHHHHITASSCSSNGSKNLKKFDPRLGPSPYRQLLPIALCILSFATVFSILIVYMDTTEIRHQQFRLNMSRDYEFYGVAQDDPQLIAFLREIHMRKYSMHFLKSRTADGGGGGVETAATSSSTLGPGNGGTPGGNLIGVQPHFNFSAHPNELTPKMAYYVANLLQGKTNGAVIQSLTGSLGHLMTAPWLADTLNWAGIIVEPEPRRFFTLRKQNGLRPRVQVVHACVSPNPYPKEITVHNEESEVRINSLLDEETTWFNSRVKCFPLYTIMLASNRVEYDLLSLGVHGHELEILQTLPFDKIRIEIISIHLLENQEDVSSYVQTLTKFLQRKGYKLQKKFGRNYFYQRLPSAAQMSATSPTRTRKKDILLKTP